MRARGTRRGGRTWLRGTLAVAAVALALLLPVANPGSGTAVNLHGVDAASIVRGDHHAKTLPTITEFAGAALLVGLAARIWRQLASRPATTAVVARTRDDVRATWPGTGILARAVLAQRGPPACA